jgi:hypothetical protein
MTTTYQGRIRRCCLRLHSVGAGGHIGRFCFRLGSVRAGGRIGRFCRLVAALQIACDRIAVDVQLVGDAPLRLAAGMQSANGVDESNSEVMRHDGSR